MEELSNPKLSRISIDQEIEKFLGSDPRIRSLCKVSPYPFFWAAAKDWGLIFSLVLFSQYTGGWIVYALSCLIIAGRQHGFFALSHEAAHYRISHNKTFNDMVSNCFFAYPVLFDTAGYRQNHIKHHGFLNSEQDPDWVRKVRLPQWQFPKPLSYVAKTFPKFLFWNGPREWFLIMLQLAKVLPLRDLRKPESLRKVSLRALYYCALAIPLTYFSLWSLFLLYWVVPLVFIFPTLQRIRSVAEHFGLERSHDLNNTRNIMAPWFEKALLAPHNINYHLDHHLIASVPFYNLPKLHDILLENQTYAKLSHENTSYLMPSERSLLRDIFLDPNSSSAEADKLGHERQQRVA